MEEMALVYVFLGLLSIFAYFVPTIIAAVRKCENTTVIVLLNIFLGWTFVGYIVCIVWAIIGEQKQPPAQINVYGQQPYYPPHFQQPPQNQNFNQPPNQNQGEQNG